jgi:hypothetical protein
MSNMTKQFKRAELRAKQTGEGDTEERTLKEEVPGICPFYYILEPALGAVVARSTEEDQCVASRKTRSMFMLVPQQAPRYDNWQWIRCLLERLQS